MLWGDRARIASLTVTFLDLDMTDPKPTPGKIQKLLHCPTLTVFPFTFTGSSGDPVNKNILSQSLIDGTHRHGLAQLLYISAECDAPSPPHSLRTRFWVSPDGAAQGGRRGRPSDVTLDVSLQKGGQSHQMHVSRVEQADRHRIAPDAYTHFP